ncbi:MAG: hypothetical protein HOF76_08785 [Candidatus Scalindua sp.]|jgi:hypothetical protein|nr:hypothetical protein [Candidatus Scalindua sp.]MBT7591401.1 hypothetical protein [Candidatus Scalindua sp.]
MFLAIVFAVSLITEMGWMFSEEYDIRAQLRDRMPDVRKKAEIVAMSKTVMV